MESILDFALPYIDPIVVLMVLLGGYFSKLYLKELNIALAIKTLIVGTFFSVVYYVLLWFRGEEIDWVKGFISYAVATSLYELILKYLNFKKNESK